VSTTDPAPSIPDRVRQRLSIALGNLRFVAEQMNNAHIQLDQNLQGGGRYEAEVLENNSDMVTRAQATVAEFRAQAAKHGVDADAVITALGGLAAPSPSPDAARWISDNKSAATERAYRGWLTTCADSAEKLRACDLDRALGYALDANELAGFSAWLTKARPDLADAIKRTAEDLMAEA
jgi:hypothetical protein